MHTDGTVLERKDNEFISTNHIVFGKFGSIKGLFSVKNNSRLKKKDEVRVWVDLL